MSGQKVAPNRSSLTAQRKLITRVPCETGEFIAPFMAHDTRIIPNTAMPDNPLTRPGLRLGVWAAESETK